MAVTLVHCCEQLTELKPIIFVEFVPVIEQLVNSIVR